MRQIGYGAPFKKTELGPDAHLREPKRFGRKWVKHHSNGWDQILRLVPRSLGSKLFDGARFRTGRHARAYILLVLGITNRSELSEKRFSFVDHYLIRTWANHVSAF